MELGGVNPLHVASMLHGVIGSGWNTLATD